MFRSAIESPVVLVEGGLALEGTSDAHAGMKLVFRHVALQQGGASVEGSVFLTDVSWSTTLPAAGFHGGDALAVGVETVFISSPPSFITETWSQIVEITVQGQSS